MATNNDNGFKISRVAPSTLATKQFHFVKLGSTGFVICSATTDRPTGVLQNNPAAGQVAEVMLCGLTKIISDGTTAIGDAIGTSSDGQAAVYVHGTDTTKYIVGEAYSAGAAGETITAFINCIGVGRAA